MDGRQHLLVDGCFRLSRVDHAPTGRIAGGLSLKTRADALVKRFELGVKAVITARAPEADAHRAVEQEGQMRPQTTACPGVRLRDDR